MLKYDRLIQGFSTSFDYHSCGIPSTHPLAVDSNKSAEIQFLAWALACFGQSFTRPEYWVEYKTLLRNKINAPDSSRCNESQIRKLGAKCSSR